MSVQDIMKDFWKKYGRSFFLRYGISSFIFASREVFQGNIFFFSILTDNRLITFVSLTFNKVSSSVFVLQARHQVVDLFLKSFEL